ncbi:GTP-binding protein Rit2 isoform X1 [Mustela lutreola]|uniref:GTP-binding protein Rit2 isoform X1 n=1 Tax=Mustela lutreola TaxID=9666 RepID=UPI002796EBDF|nr:GTP-binding protein Rit2 isoform X1 [Mustela lutreola]
MTPLLTCHTPPPFGVSTTPTYFKLTNFPSRFLPWNTYAYILTMNSVYLTTLHLCLEDAYKTQVRIDDEPAYLDILDTAGQAEFTAMREQYMRGGEGFIICYSITDRQSFQEAAKFKELIFQVRHTYEIPLVLVGNKIDLEQFRQVSTEEGWSLAREYNCAFFETSAALRFCIDDAFHGLVREIRKKESMPSLMEKKLKRKDSLWKKLKSSLKKKKENMT